MSDAELLCPNRPHPASLLAALARVDEALDHIAPEEKEKKALSAKRMLHLLQELAGQGQAEAREIQRFAARIAAAAPERASDAWLAARGLGAGAAAIDSASSSAELTELLASDFFQMFTRVLHEAAEPLHQPGLTESQEAGAGRLVGRARLLSQLEHVGDPAGRGRVVVCVEAEAAVRTIERSSIRGVALSELAMAWQHPGTGGDFKRSTQLLDEALTLIPPGWRWARADATSYRARALRYRADIPAHEAIELAILAYQEAAALHQQNGEGSGLACALKNLAEAVSARQDRPRAVALREGKLVHEGKPEDFDLATLKSIYGQEAEFGFEAAS